MPMIQRRRVMVDSDNETSKEEASSSSSSPNTKPTPPDSSTRRRMRLGGLEDESGIVGLEDVRDVPAEIEGVEQEDEMELKRRRQLAERWSNLVNDSDHVESSDDEKRGKGGRGRRSALVQMSVHDAWQRRTPSKTVRRFLVREPRSGDDDDDPMDDLDDFIVNSEEEEEGASRASKSRQRKARRAKRSECANDDAAAGAVKKKGKKRRAMEMSSEEEVVNELEDGEDVADIKDGDGGNSLNDEEDDDDDDDVKGAARRKRKRVSSKVNSTGDKAAASRGIVSASTVPSSNELEEVDKELDDEQKRSQTAAGATRRRKMSGKEGRKQRVKRRVVHDGHDDHDGSSSDPDPVTATAQLSGGKTRTRRGQVASGQGGEAALDSTDKTKSADGVKPFAEGGTDEDEDEDPCATDDSGHEGEEESVRTPTVGDGGEACDSRTRGDRGRPTKAKRGAKLSISQEGEATLKTPGRSGSASRRTPSRLNYRAVLMDSSSEEECNVSGDGSSLAVEDEKQQEKEQQEEYVPTDDSGDSENGDEANSSEHKGKRRRRRKRRRKTRRCATDMDADRDESFARDLDAFPEDEDEYEGGDDDEGQESENDERNVERLHSSRHGVRKSARLSERVESSREEKEISGHDDDVDEEESSEEGSAIVDDDDDDDEGDVHFSHAAFFQEQEQSQEVGMSSFSVESMTFEEAFLLYVEYLARATADDGAGGRFMKKYVAQPMLPEHARYKRAKDTVEKKVCVTRESLCGTWQQNFRNSIFRYPHYAYQHVDMVDNDAHCDACNRSNSTKLVAFLSGAEYDPVRVWESLRWDLHLPKGWDNPDKMAASKREARASHRLGDTCKHKSHLYHSLVHYKLYLVCKVAAKTRSDRGLKPENFRGEGGGNKKKVKRCLHFSENEFESLSSLLSKADEMNGVKWGPKAGVRGGHGKSFLQVGAGATILDFLSREAAPGQYSELDVFNVGGNNGDGTTNRGHQSIVDVHDDSDDEAEFEVGRGRRWPTIGSTGGGRYG